MPHPGLRVSTSPLFRGEISGIFNDRFYFFRLKSEKFWFLAFSFFLQEIFTCFVFILFCIDIEMEFQQQLRCLVPRLLDSSNLLMKKINGNEVTCRELVEYFKVFHILFSSFFIFDNFV